MTTTTILEIYALGRALSFSLLAPLQFFYGLWIGNFPTPYFFLVLLLSGYTFAILSSVSAQKSSGSAYTMTVLSLYSMALFFIVLVFIMKIVKKNK